MKFRRIITAAAATTIFLAPQVMAQALNDNMNGEQKKAIEKIVHDYIVNNPEVLVEASQALQQKQQEMLQSQAKKYIIENADALFTEKLAVTGNLQGNVTLIEFFDYQCIHCKKMSPTIKKLIEANPKLRVIYKEFPIFGAASELASQVALAAAMQGKYMQMHDALLNLEERLDENLIMETAKSIGLNMEKLKTDMKSAEVQKALEQNRQLAEKIHLMGTPAFIIAPTPGGKLKANTEPAFIPGGATQETMQNFINNATKEINN